MLNIFVQFLYNESAVSPLLSPTIISTTKALKVALEGFTLRHTLNA